MRRTAFVLVAAITAVLLYPWLHRWVFGLAAVYLLPPALLHAAKHLGGLPGLVSLHAVVSFLLTVLLFSPVAVLIALAFRKAWIVVAAVAAAWVVAPDLVAIPDIWRQVDHASYVRTLVLEVTAVLGALLTSTYAASQLTSNNRWGGP